MHYMNLRGAVQKVDENCHSLAAFSGFQTVALYYYNYLLFQIHGKLLVSLKGGCKNEEEKMEDCLIDSDCACLGRWHLFSIFI